MLGGVIYFRKIDRPPASTEQKPSVGRIKESVMRARFSSLPGGPRALTFTLFLAATLLASPARADSGRFNLHFDLGGLIAGPPVAGGGGFHIGADLVLARPIALDVVIGAGGLAAPDPVLDTVVGTWFVDFAAGVRLRFLDDQRGNLFLVPRIGLLATGFTLSGSFDATFGYEWKVAERVQLGPYLRPGVSFNGTGAGGYAFLGLVVSVKVVDMPKDQDRDGVVDGKDQCPDTPLGTEVDGRGCAVLRREMVLRGITFETDRAEIKPASERALQSAAQGLRDNPKARVEISGHTDDVGTPDHNQLLSEARANAVVDWLVAHGVDRGRLSAIGFGMQKPQVPNSNEENRARNRRIEFHRIDE